jgi:hypothetical protein
MMYVGAMEKRKVKKFNPAKAKRRLDRLFSQYILGRDQRKCCRCGASGGKCDTSHVIPREVLSLRWDPRNAFALCFKCHKLVWHKNPLEGVRWLREYLGDHECDELLELSTHPYDFTESEATKHEAVLRKLLATLPEEQQP